MARMKHKPRMTDQEVLGIVAELCERWQKFWDKEQWRAEHYFNLPNADTELPESLRGFKAYQSDMLRQYGSRVKSRLMENPYTVRVEPPRDTAKMREAASNLEVVMTKGNELSQERSGIDPQSALAELVRLPFSVIHWCKFDEIYPDVPTPEYLDMIGDDEERADYEPLYRDDGEPEDAEDTFPYSLDGAGMVAFDDTGLPKRRKLSRYRQTDDAVQRNYRESKAKSGYPWFHEAIPTTAFAMLPDRSLANGMAMVLVRRTISVLRYVEALNHKRGAKRDNPDIMPTSVNEVNPDIPVYGEQPAPEWWEPNGSWNSGDRVTIYQLWTRDECYEIVGPDTGTSAASIGGMQVADCYQHPYKMPPFAIAYGVINEGTYDPELRYESPLEGLYRQKPVFDRAITLMAAIAEMIALPYYYWKRTDDGAPLTEDGKVRYFTRNAADADLAPPGYELAKLDYELNPAYKDAVALLKELFESAAPATGQAEFTASTQPWAIRLQQAQQNIEPGRWLGNMARALTVMERNKAMVMSLDPEDGGTGEVPIFAHVTKGKKDSRTLISVKPKDITSLDISVVIDSTTQAERITKERTGAEMLKDGLITMAEYIEDWKGDQDPDKAMRALTVERIFGQYIEPTLMQQIMASIGYVIGPNGQAIDTQGQAVDPRGVLASKGYTPNTQMQPGAGGGGAMSQQVMPQNQMGDLASLQAPGTMALPGVQG